MHDPTPAEEANVTIRVVAHEDVDLVPDDEPIAFVTRLPFELLQDGVLIGKGMALLFHVEDAREDGIRPAELFDCIDDDVHQLYTELFDQETDEIPEHIAEPGGGGGVLYVQQVKVIAKRRCRKIGLKAVQRLRRSFAMGCSVITLKAAAMQVEEDMPDEIDELVFRDPFPRAGAAAAERLREYWGSIGFRRIGTSDYMALDLTTKVPLIAPTTR